MAPPSTMAPRSEDRAPAVDAGATERQGGSLGAGPVVGEGRAVNGGGANGSRANGRAATGPAQTIAPGAENGPGAAGEAPGRNLVYDASGVSSPEEIARQAVEARQGLFRVLGWATAKPIDMLTGRRAFDADELLKYAVRIEQLAPMIKDVYRLDTRYTGVPSRSLDAVWDHRSEFDAMVGGLRVDAATAVVAARTGEREASLQAFKRLAESCYECHDKFRLNGSQFPNE